MLLVLGLVAGRRWTVKALLVALLTVVSARSPSHYIQHCMAW
jgi:hypothetical protein